ncbi:DNA-binding transcriptional LysR family regulator [Rhodoferax ferrireducens]|uniref:DNA-binding transcriptional LysR family regulator n=1 Tax=Rhodoferax ferrireducens TaxID=192843 RepID=A0ABU2CAM3_9BURK|nr:LysR family transcriptional regulator [Rhodoferax ferrireducens]MDR7378387.1 DNA-binding transcriptional LysR family regulator [Rhodoferax ferrireducens]
MQTARDVLTPDALSMLVTIHTQGSFAAAARSLGMVPSALTYRVRNIEDALDVLLFDRSSRQAKLTVAGAELLREGQRLLEEIDAVANRVKRVATGWEPQLTIAVDSVISRSTVMELCEAFFAMSPPTRVKLREEVLHGTLDALVTGQADLSIGVAMEMNSNSNILGEVLGTMPFIFAVAPHHPLASMPEPLSDTLIEKHRAVAVADSTQRGNALTFGLLGGQDVLTVPSMRAKLEAQLRGLGCGFLPEGLARPYLETGRLVSRTVERPSRILSISYAWRAEAGSTHGRALQWWLQQLKSPATRTALLERQQSN